jgi:hypothetical protein
MHCLLAFGGGRALPEVRLRSREDEDIHGEALLPPDEHDSEAMCWNSQYEFAMVEMQMLRRRHRSGGTEFGDLGLVEVASGAAHRVKGLEDVAVVIVDAQDFDGGVGGDVLEVKVEGLRWAGWA